MAYEWTPDKMITAKRVTHVASRLFPDEVHSGDCLSEIGREGQPCRICAERNATWSSRLESVRVAMFEAFGYDPTK